jgi:predicted nucleic acid-binding protein
MRCTSADIYTLDTNVLVYSVDRTAGPRHDLAKQIMSRAASGPCCLTLQSVSEFFAVARRKGMMASTEAAGVAESMIDLFPTAVASVSSVRTALATAVSGRASYWDALLVITAAEAGCTAILTEDLADDTTFAGVRVINPFAGATLSAAAEALLTLD